MVRKERVFTDQRLTRVDAGPLQYLVEEWLQKIRTRLTDAGTVVATIHKLPRHRFLVSFRASAFGETFISEVRESRLEDGVNEAGSRLFERLSQNPPQPKPNLPERVWRLFSEREAG